MFLLLLMFSTNVRAIEACTDVFSGSPIGGQLNNFEVPANPPNNLGDLTCTQGGNGNNRSCSVSDSFSPGDYFFEDGSFKKGDFITTSGTTTRLFFNSLSITSNANLNLNGESENLIIVVRGDLTISGRTKINAIIYATGDVNISGNVDIDGAIAAGSNMSLSGNAINNFDYVASAVNNADFNGMCTSSSIPTPNPSMLFGMIEQADSVGTIQQVSFNNDFADGVIPLVFMMPTINPSDTQGDGSATIRVVNVTSSGFTWVQIEPPVRFGNTVNHSEPMREISWIAVEPGNHSLQDGTRFEAGSASVASAFNFNSQPWTNVPITSGLSLGISQLQSNNNSQCWFTSAAELGSGFIRLGLDPSLAYDDGSSFDRCANRGPRNINAETIAYLAFEPADGEVILNNQRIKYQFGAGFNRDTERPGWSLAQQCNDYMTDLSGFSVPPIFIGKKEGRFGVQGGWFRRCRLSNSQVSMVVDEDVYGGNRRHLKESYNYVAFEVMEDVSTSIDHFEMSYTGTPLTCQAQDVTVKACANASCSELVTQQVSATLNPLFNVADGGWYQNNTRINDVTFSGGQVQLAFRNYNRGSIQLGMSNASPTFLNPTLCGLENSNLRTEGLCNLTFSNRGFEILAPNKYANKPDSLSIRALRRDPNDPDECIADFINTTKPVKFYSEYLQPSIPEVSANVTIDSQDVGNTQTSPTTINVSFNSQGMSNLDFNYLEAGKVSIHAELVRSDDTQGIPIIGTGSFVSVPYGLCFEAKDALASCGSNDQNCSVYKTAGSFFDLTIQSKAWQNSNDANICNNLDTKNYMTDSGTYLSLSSQVVAPSGGNDGLLAASSGNAEQYSYLQGSNTFQRSISESGIFKLTATTPNSYLGVLASELPIQEGVTSSIGRFVPTTFDVSEGMLAQSCDDFTYLGQPFQLNFTVQAKNLQGNITTNYEGVFAKASGTFIGDDGVNSINNRLKAIVGQVSNEIPMSSLNFINGVASVNLTPTFNRLQSTSNPRMDGPFTQPRFGLQLFDNESNTSVHTQLLNPNFSVGENCDVNTPQSCNAVRLGNIAQSLDFRHGRIVVDNAYGAGNKPLKSEIVAEYWNGSQWMTNDKDSCTALNSAALTTNTIYTPSLTSGQSIERYFTNNLSEQLQLGKGAMFWSRSGTDNYQGEVNSGLVVTNYLNWYWNRNGNNPDELQNPFSSAFFGQFSGHDKVIYWRENIQ